MKTNTICLVGLGLFAFSCLSMTIEIQRRDSRKPVAKIYKSTASQFSVDTEKPIDPKELHCLALNIYHEARSESVLGQALVAQVTQNRVESERFPDSICEVVYQSKQFSWVDQDKQLNINNSQEQLAWMVANKVAYAMMVSENDFLMHNVLYYHNNEVNPKWAKNMDKQLQVGKHIFYSE